MNEIITITIAKQLFHIEKDAYHTLDTYLTSIRNKFSSHPEKDEIVFDIESRIAEHLKEKSKDNVVTSIEVKDIIAQMGQPEDLDDDDESSSKEQSSSSQTRTRKLYRNPDDSIIGGVASGIAAFFNIDPLIVRLVFLVTLLAGGSGVLIYILLWIITPEAKTATEKLQMFGRPVTLESVKEMAEKGAKHVRESDSVKKVGSGIAAVVTGIGRVIKFFLKIITFIIGLAVMIATTIASIALGVALFVTLFNGQSSYVDSPFLHSLDKGTFFAVVIFGFLVLFVPLIFLSTLGKLIMRGKGLPAKVSYVLLGVWVLSLIGAAAITPKVVNDYQNLVETSPDYQKVTRSAEVPVFTTISLPHSYRATLIQAPVQEVKITGRNKDLDQITVSVKDGALTVDRKDENKICIFCFTRSVELEIRVPDITRIEARNASSITSPGFKFKDIELVAENAARIDLQKVTANNITAKLTNASRIEISGTAPILKVDATNSSSLRAFDLIVDDVIIKGTNSSRMRVNAVKTLNATLTNSSRVYYMGTPSVTERTSNSSSVQPEVEEEYDY